MKPEEIKKAVEYKQGHFNMVQYILREKPEWSISVYDIEEDRFPIEKSKNFITSSGTFLSLNILVMSTICFNFI